MARPPSVWIAAGLLLHCSNPPEPLTARGLSTHFSPTALEWRVPDTGGDPEHGYDFVSGVGTPHAWRVLALRTGRPPVLLRTHPEADLVHEPGPEGFALAPTSLGSGLPGARWLDLDCDGRVDRVAPAGPEGSVFREGDEPIWRVQLGRDGGFGPRITWALPQGGHPTRGFHALAGTARPGGESWRVLDLEGDGCPELVVTGPFDPERPTRPGQTWRVHPNTGRGFAVEPKMWRTPGMLHAEFIGRLGAWALRDLTCDGRLDLVVTASVGQTAPVWWLYPGTPEGFEQEPRELPMPDGVRRPTAGVSHAEPSTAHHDLLDLDADGCLDLVVFGEALPTDDGAPRSTVFEPEDRPHWRLYANAGGHFREASRFAVPPITLEGDFAHRREIASRPGSRSWEVLDLDGDGRLDLVDTGFNPEGAPEGAERQSWGLDEGRPHWRLHRGQPADTENP